MPVVSTSDPRDVALAFAAGRGPVIAILTDKVGAAVPACVGAVLAHTPPETAILVLDDGCADPGIEDVMTAVGAGAHRVVVLRQAELQDAVRAANLAFELAGRRDVVLLRGDVLVGPGWLDGLREAAYSDTRIATATPLANGSGLVSVSDRARPGETSGQRRVEDPAVAVARMSRRLRPRIATCAWHCTYVRRGALDVVGGFAETFPCGDGAPVDFSQRCLQAGLAHVCADDVLVELPPGADVVAVLDDPEIATRYPYLSPWLRATARLETTPLACALAIARRALGPLTVAIDAVALGPGLMGTQRLAVEAARALAQHPGVREVVVVTMPGPRPVFLEEALGDVPSVRLVADDAAAKLAADVAYRPVPVWAVDGAERLRRFAPRSVIHHLDLIAYNNPSYFPTWRDWVRCRDGTRFALAAADGIAFLSAHAEAEARAEGLVPEGTRTRRTFIGIDHVAAGEPESQPAGLSGDLQTGGFVLCLGADFRHKNRLFALRVFAAMCARGYRGHLILAGPRMAYGSSRTDEAAFLAQHPAVMERVISLAEVSETERVWLYRHARLVLHPTLYEGFGLVPFEVACAGTPCLSSRATSLDEVLPRGIQVITEWNPERVAEQALRLLEEPERRAAMVEALAMRAREFTWARTAEELVQLFDAVCRAAPRPRVLAVEGEGGAVSERSASADELAMLDGMYPREVYEMLRAIGQRETLRRPMVAVTTWAYRIGSALRVRRRRREGR